MSAFRLVLASASPRRAELLRAAGLEFNVLPVEIDETIRHGETPAAYVRRLAAEKSARALQALAEHELGARAGVEPVVLGADTAVVVDGKILGKPRDHADAAAVLRRLSGRRHEVLTGVSLRRGPQEIGRTESTVVEFAPLTSEEIEWYIASGEGRDKAGAYGIQGLASRFITRIEGSYSNVVGLPISSVYELLRRSTGTLAAVER